MPVTRVAIVGGGFAGIAAAWSLSQQKDFQVDIYEKSWRLGGKTASARADGGYIVDNSLGVWLGFYENAFRMMRQCYAEVERCKWGPDANAGDVLLFGRMEDAFFPEPNVGAWGRNPKTSEGTGDFSPDWAVWSAYFPPANGLPGEPMDEDSNPFTLKNYLFRSFELLKTLTLSVIRAPDEDPRGEPRPDDRSVSDQILNFNYSVDGAASLQLMIERATKLLRAGSLTGAALWLQAVTILEVWLQDFNFGLQSADSALNLVEAVAAQTRKLLRDFVAIDPEIRFRTEIIDLVLTIAVGLFRDRVLFDDSGLIQSTIPTFATGSCSMALRRSPSVRVSSPLSTISRSPTATARRQSRRSPPASHFEDCCELSLLTGDRCSGASDRGWARLCSPPSTGS